MKGTSGKRRTSVKHHPSDVGGGRSVANGASTAGTSGGASGIDSFLHRLDNDLDLKNMKKRSLAGEDSRKASDIDAPTASPSKAHPPPSTARGAGATPNLPKRAAQVLFAVVALYLVHDTLTSPPEKRLLGSRRMRDFLLWVKEHPGSGAAAFVVVYGACVALLLPGTPLTLGGGYVYKVSYGWSGGVAMATLTSMAGSLLGSVSCFVMGRYVMRERVRKWGRKYPLFDAIDLAVSDNGFRIMCLLYLTPILPLGPVSYLLGTTSMPLAKFAMAKIAALPLMLLYVLIGASTDTFFGGSDAEVEGGEGAAAAKTVHGVDEETHRKMVFFGLFLSIISMSLVSYFVKKELYKVSRPGPATMQMECSC
ncbi:hypothetical protein ACHAWF_010398 [Thalassiosira exigua]